MQAEFKVADDGDYDCYDLVLKLDRVETEKLLDCFSLDGSEESLELLLVLKKALNRWGVYSWEWKG